MKIILLQFLILLSILLNNSFAIGQDVIPIVPKPKEISINSESYNFSNNTISISIHGLSTSDIQTAIDGLNDVTNKFLNKSIQIVDSGKADISIGLPSKDRDFRIGFENKDIKLAKEIDHEGYVLNIANDGIIIGANSSAGLFYGIQSIKQLIRGNGGNSELKGMTISDWPDMKIRGVLDDISRGPVPTLGFMKNQVRRFAELKLNMLSYYVEHVVSIPSDKNFGPAGGGISLDEWSELVEYAEKYHIQLIGNFQSFGHFEKILAYSRYNDLGISDRMLNPLKDESYELLYEVYSKFVPVFNSEYFNINSDEAWDLNSVEMKDEVDRIGAGNVYYNHIMKLYNELKKYNKKTMIWGDMVLSHPELLEKLPKDIIMIPWGYDPQESFMNMIDPIKNAGFEFFVTPGVLNSNRLMPNFEKARGNFKQFVKDGFENGALGVFNSVWDDGGLALFSRDWLGMAYGADKSWNVYNDADIDFNERFDRSTYGNGAVGFSDVLMKFVEFAEYYPTQELNDGIFWNQLVSDRGKKLDMMMNDWGSIGELAVEIDDLLSKIKLEDYSTDIEYIKFTNAQYKFMSQARFDLVKAAEYYAEAGKFQYVANINVNPRMLVVNGLEKVIKTKSALYRLREEHKRLWLMENRSYWLDNIMDLYEKGMNDLINTENLVTEALNDFDKGLILPPNNEVRLDIRPSNAQYFRFWLLNGPFPSPAWSGAENDYLGSLGGELKAIPTVYDFTQYEGKSYKWNKFNSDSPAGIDLTKYYEKNTEAVAYAYCRITAPETKEYKATFGSNDGIEVILNGKSIFKNVTKRSLELDEDEVMMPLKKGNNHLLVKIIQNKAGWGFSFRMPDNVIRNHKQKYKIIK